VAGHGPSVTSKRLARKGGDPAPDVLAANGTARWSVAAGEGSGDVNVTKERGLVVAVR